MSLVWSDIAPSNETAHRVRFDLNETNNEVRFFVGPYSVATISAVKETTWATAVLTLERSIDGSNWFALETAQTLGPGSALSATIDTSAIAWLRARLSTKEGSTVYAQIRAMGKYDA